MMNLLIALCVLAPATPHASPEARELLAYLTRLSGRGTLIGQHNYPQAGARTEWMEKARALTGRDPAVWGSDLGWDKSCKEARPGLVEEAIRQWRAGSLVELSWHPVRPMDEDGTDAPNSWKGMVQNRLSDADWKRLVRVGSPLNRRWLAQIDAVAVHLKALRDARVPVLWRPYHEMNGGWFWWGDRPGSEGYARLWRQMFDRYSRVHRLDNLLWVWSPNAPDGKWAKATKDYYPGHDVVDLLALDVYHGDYQPRYYDELLAVGGGKPMALGEVGALPSPEILKAQPRWLWFLAWAEHLTGDNGSEAIAATFQSPRVLGRAEARARRLGP